MNEREEHLEIEHINNIYKELGFDGVIEYAKDKLSQYGTVKETEKGLYVMITGGWSDNEHWLNCLTDITCIFGYKHYVGRLRGGALYFSTKEHDMDIEIILNKQKTKLLCDKDIAIEKVCTLIDEEIEILEEKYKFGQEIYQGCPMHNIQFGINTLKQLKKRYLND